MSQEQNLQLPKDDKDVEPSPRNTVQKRAFHSELKVQKVVAPLPSQLAESLNLEDSVKSKGNNDYQEEHHASLETQAKGSKVPETEFRKYEDPRYITARQFRHQADRKLSNYSIDQIIGGSSESNYVEPRLDLNQYEKDSAKLNSDLIPIQVKTERSVKESNKEDKDSMANLTELRIDDGYGHKATPQFKEKSPKRHINVQTTVREHYDFNSGGDEITTYHHFGIPDKRYEKKTSAVKKEHIVSMQKLPITAAMTQYNQANALKAKNQERLNLIKNSSYLKKFAVNVPQKTPREYKAQIIQQKVQIEKERKQSREKNIKSKIRVNTQETIRSPSGDENQVINQDLLDTDEPLEAVLNTRQIQTKSDDMTMTFADGVTGKQKTQYSVELPPLKTRGNSRESRLQKSREKPPSSTLRHPRAGKASHDRGVDQSGLPRSEEHAFSRHSKKDSKFRSGGEQTSYYHSKDQSDMNPLLQVQEHQMTLDMPTRPRDEVIQNFEDSDFESIPHSDSQVHRKFVQSISPTSNERIIDQLMQSTRTKKNQSQFRNNQVYGYTTDANTSAIARSHAESFSTQSEFQKMMESRSHILTKDEIGKLQQFRHGDINLEMNKAKQAGIQPRMRLYELFESDRAGKAKTNASVDFSLLGGSDRKVLDMEGLELDESTARELHKSLQLGSKGTISSRQLIAMTASTPPQCLSKNQSNFLKDQSRHIKARQHQSMLNSFKIDLGEKMKGQANETLESSVQKIVESSVKSAQLTDGGPLSKSIIKGLKNANSVERAKIRQSNDANVEHIRLYADSILGVKSKNQLENNTRLRQQALEKHGPFGMIERSSPLITRMQGSDGSDEDKMEVISSDFSTMRNNAGSMLRPPTSSSPERVFNRNFKKNLPIGYRNMNPMSMSVDRSRAKIAEQSGEDSQLHDYLQHSMKQIPAGVEKARLKKADVQRYQKLFKLPQIKDLVKEIVRPGDVVHGVNQLRTYKNIVESQHHHDRWFLIKNRIATMKPTDPLAQKQKVERLSFMTEKFDTVKQSVMHQLQFQFENYKKVMETPELIHKSYDLMSTSAHRRTKQQHQRAVQKMHLDSSKVIETNIQSSIHQLYLNAQNSQGSKDTKEEPRPSSDWLDKRIKIWEGIQGYVEDRFGPKESEPQLQKLPTGAQANSFKSAKPRADSPRTKKRKMVQETIDFLDKKVEWYKNLVKQAKESQLEFLHNKPIDYRIVIQQGKKDLDESKAAIINGLSERAFKMLLVFKKEHKFDNKMQAAFCNSLYHLTNEDFSFRESMFVNPKIGEFFDQILQDMEEQLNIEQPNFLDQIQAEEDKREKFLAKIPQQVRTPKERVKYVEVDNRKALLEYLQRDKALKTLLDELFEQNNFGHAYKQVGESMFAKPALNITKRSRSINNLSPRSTSPASGRSTNMLSDSLKPKKMHTIAAHEIARNASQRVETFEAYPFQQIADILVNMEFYEDVKAGSNMTLKALSQQPDQQIDLKTLNNHISKILTRDKEIVKQQAYVKDNQYICKEQQLKETQVEVLHTFMIRTVNIEQFRIHTVILDSNQLSDAFFAKILRGIKAQGKFLERLYYSRNSLGLESVEEMELVIPQLTHLCISKLKPVSGEGQIPETVLATFLEACIMRGRELKKFTLSGMNLSSEKISTELINLIRGNTNIEDYDLSWSCLLPEQMNEIARILSENTQQLVSLDLSYNPLQFDDPKKITKTTYGLPVRGLANIEQSLQEIRKEERALRKKEQEENGEEEDEEELSESLQAIQNLCLLIESQVFLKHLNLSGLALRKDPLVKICKAIRKSTSLEGVHMNNNQIQGDLIIRQHILEILDMNEGQLPLEKRRKFKKNIAFERPQLLKATSKEYFKNEELFNEENDAVLKEENQAVLYKEFYKKAIFKKQLKEQKEFNRYFGPNLEQPESQNVDKFVFTRKLNCPELIFNLDPSNQVYFEANYQHKWKIENHHSCQVCDERRYVLIMFCQDADHMNKGLVEIKEPAMASFVKSSIRVDKLKQVIPLIFGSVVNSSYEHACQMLRAEYFAMMIASHQREFVKDRQVADTLQNSAVGLAREDNQHISNNLKEKLRGWHFLMQDFCFENDYIDMIVLNPTFGDSNAVSSVDAESQVAVHPTTPPIRDVVSRGDSQLSGSQKSREETKAKPRGVSHPSYQPYTSGHFVYAAYLPLGQHEFFIFDPRNGKLYSKSILVTAAKPKDE